MGFTLAGASFVCVTRALPKQAYAEETAPGTVWAMLTPQSCHAQDVCFPTLCFHFYHILCSYHFPPLHCIEYKL